MNAYKGIKGMNPNLNVITLEEARRILEEIEEVERNVKHLESVSK